MAEPCAEPVDRLLGGYLLLSAIPLLLPGRTSAWPLLLPLHAALGGLLLYGAATRLRQASKSGAARALIAWYPLLLLPFLYWELPHLSGSLHGGRFFDGVVMGWEERLFGHQPSATLAQRWSSGALSELLHLAYLGYYPSLYALPVALYLRRREAAFRETVFALMLGFTFSYLVFTVFPVQGPRYLFPAPGGEAAGGLFYRLTHAVLETGSSQGAAFPSAHAAAAAVQTIAAARHHPSFAPVLGVLTIGIAAGAVYGGFHYAVDVLAGLGVGLALGWAAPDVRRRLL